MKFETKKKDPITLDAGDIFKRGGSLYFLTIDNRLSGSQYRVVCLDGDYISMDSPKHTLVEAYEKYFGYKPHEDPQLFADNIIKKDDVLITYKK